MHVSVLQMLLVKLNILIIVHCASKKLISKASEIIIFMMYTHVLHILSKNPHLIYRLFQQGFVNNNGLLTESLI